MKKLLLVGVIIMIVAAIYRMIVAEYLTAWIDLVFAVTFYMISKFIDR